MESIVRETAVAVYAAIFTLLAARALLDWRRRGDTSSLWFGAAFGALATVVVASTAAGMVTDDDPPAWVSHALVALLSAYPPCLLWFAGTFGGITRAERRTAIVVFAGLAVWGGAFAQFPPPGTPGDAPFLAYSAAFVTAWIVVSIRVIATLWLTGRHRPGIVRGRMRLLAVGFALLDVALLVQALDHGEQLRALVTTISAIAAISLLLGFTPPQWLRIVLRQPEQQRVRSAVAGIAAAATEAEVVDALLPATLEVIDAKNVAFLPHGDGDVLAIGFGDDELAAIRSWIADHADAPDDRVYLVDDKLVSRGPSSWIVVDRPAGGAFFGSDEIEMLGSMDAILRMSISRVRDSAAIREHEQQLQTAIDIAEIGKWHWNVGADDVWWSPRMYDIFGVDSYDALTFERFLTLIAPEDRDRVQAQVASALDTHEPYEIQHRIVRPDGSEAWVQARARVICDDEGEPVRITGVTIDVTERVRSEQELRDAVEAEREATRRLRALDELKTNILSAVSHELRTPLTAVHGFAILLQDRMEELEPERRGEIVRHLVSESERLAQLFADLLDIDRLRRGAIEAQRAPVNLRELVLEIVIHRDQRERIVLDLQVDSFELDAPKVSRILENLVVNAEKYAGHGTRIRVATVIRDEALELRVEDDGPGVPEHLREAIFEPFNRGDAELGHAPGTGIGLSLVRQFARLHDGNAWVEPSPSGGASFVVRIPATGVVEPVRSPAG